MRTALVAGLFAMMAFAGCLDSDNDPTPGGDPSVEPESTWVHPMNFTALGHDHGDPSQHDIANNITQVAHLALGPNGPPGGISEIDIAGNHAFIGVMGHGFMVVDITNITAPVLVADVMVEIPDQQLPTDVYLADLKVDSTGDWVFVATELSTTPGVLIYDARDKSNINLAGFWPEPGLLLGCHMIEYAIIAEQEYLFCAPLDNALYVGLLLPPVGEPGTSVREVLQVARWMPTTTKFAQQQVDALTGYVQSCNQEPGCMAGAALHFVSGHQDMTYQLDPLNANPMLTVSFWNLGLRFVDVSIPAAPAEVGSWQGETATKWDGQLHTSMMFEANDRRIAVSIPEVSRPPAMFILDNTQFSDPQLVAEWQPVDDYYGEDGGTFSMHNFQIVNGKVYLTMYHGGIWVLDVSTPELLAEPAVLGTYMPWDRSEENYGRGCCGGILSWDIAVHKGYMLTANGGGFFVLALKGDPLGDEDYNSFA